MSSLPSRQETLTIKPRQQFEGHTDYVDTAIHLPDGQRMMTCSMDGSLRLWNLKSGKQIGEDWRDGNSGVCTIALSPNGKKVVSGSFDGGVRIWDMDTGKVIMRWMGHTATVWSACWSRDSRQVMCGSGDGAARQWDVENGEMTLGPIDTGHIHVNAVIYSPDMTMFATAASGYHIPWTESPVKVWDTKTGELLAAINGHRSGWVWCLAWTPDGKTLISGSFDQSIRTWDTTTWKQIALLEYTNIVHTIAISPNGRILASASFDHTAQLWNLDNNQLIGGPPLQHAHPVASMSFSPDGKLLATCSSHNAYTWDVTAILKQAGLDHLLDQRDAVDATRRPVRHPIKVSPRDFFDDAPRLSPRHRLQSPSSPSHGTLRDHFLSLFRPTHLSARDTPSRRHPFHWVRNHLSDGPSSIDIDVYERPSTVVDVSYAKGKRRNASAREKRRPIPKNHTASTSRPFHSNTAQQSSGVAHPQSTSQTQPQAAIYTSSTTSEPINSRTKPHAMIKHAGGWTRFWLFICCASPEYTDGHH